MTFSQETCCDAKLFSRKVRTVTRNDVSAATGFGRLVPLGTDFAVCALDQLSVKDEAHSTHHRDEKHTL